MISTYNRQRLLLLLGDIAFILLATQLSALIRFGHFYRIFHIHTGATIFTLVLYLVSLYIFGLYHTGRNFRDDEWHFPWGRQAF
jgi:hypothetical protein